MKLLKSLCTFGLGFYLSISPAKAQDKFKINLYSESLDTTSQLYLDIKNYLIREINSKETYQALDLDSSSRMNLSLELVPLDAKSFEIGGTAAFYDPKDDILVYKVAPIINEKIKTIIPSFIVHELKHKSDLGPESKCELLPETSNYFKKLRNNEIKESEDDELRFKERIKIEKRAEDATIRYYKLKLEDTSSIEEFNAYKEIIEILENDKNFKISKLEKKLKEKFNR